jgi:hypothetical protein
MCELDHQNLKYQDWFAQASGTHIKLMCRKCGKYIKFLNHNEINAFSAWKETQGVNRGEIIQKQVHRKILIQETFEEIYNYLSGIDMNPQLEKIRKRIDELKEVNGKG